MPESNPQLEEEVFNFEVETIEVPILDVHPNTWNPNSQADTLFAKLKSSIKKYGFLHPILVRRHKGEYEIIDGFHRYKAMMALGKDKITVNCIKQDVPDLAAKFLTIISNKLHGEHDVLKEARIYLEAKKSGQVGLFDELPETESEIEAALKFVGKWPLDQFDGAKLEDPEDADPYAELLKPLLKAEALAQVFHKKSRSPIMRAWLETFMQLADKYKGMNNG